MGGIIAIVVVILIVVIWFISTSNSLNRAVIKIDEADSGIDVALTKRYDVLTKMLDTVKGYAKHEKEVIVETINLRKGMTMTEKNEVNNKMNEAFSKLNVVVENYPDLKASDNFAVLQQSISDVEEHLQAARRLYNANVSSFNQMIVTFPTSVVAVMKKLVKKDFFEAEETKKQDVKIEF